MVAYSFKARFAEPILAGTKCQTIRADRRRHARPGEELQLYTGMRTRQCRLIRRVTCFDVRSIGISFVLGGAVMITGGRIGGSTSIFDLDKFAREDGFADWDDMRAFWCVQHGELAEWQGILITWQKPLAIEDKAA